MRHAVLTCKHHTHLRWFCKDIAFSDKGGYNGCRNIFFDGTPTDKGLYSDGSGLDCTTIDKNGDIVPECECPTRDLIRAPEDLDVLKSFAKKYPDAGYDKELALLEKVDRSSEPYDDVEAMPEDHPQDALDAEELGGIRDA